MAKRPTYESVKRLARSRGMEYLDTLPDVIPAGKVLVHNHATVQHPLNMGGFRAWLSPKRNALNLVPCSCSWVKSLGVHYRIGHAPPSVDLKVFENRLRRTAARRGFVLQKSRRRDEKAIDFGGYMLTDARTNTPVMGADPFAYSADLDAVAAFLG